MATFGGKFSCNNCSFWYSSGSFWEEELYCKSAWLDQYQFNCACLSEQHITIYWDLQLFEATWTVGRTREKLVNHKSKASDFQAYLLRYYVAEPGIMCSTAKLGFLFHEMFCRSVHSKYQVAWNLVTMSLSWWIFRHNSHSRRTVHKPSLRFKKILYWKKEFLIFHRLWIKLPPENICILVKYNYFWSRRENWI